MSERRPEVRLGYVVQIKRSHLDVLAEVCPVCAAQSGNKCTTVGFTGWSHDTRRREVGKVMAKAHTQRRTMAIRRRNATT